MSWDEVDLPQRDLQSPLHPDFPHMLSKGGCSAAQGCLSPEILFPAGELNSSNYVTPQCFGAYPVICTSQKRNAAALLAADGFATAAFILLESLARLQ